MSYTDDVEREFRELLAKGSDVEVLVRWLKDKVLQSYRDGQVAPERRTPALIA